MREKAANPKYVTLSGIVNDVTCNAVLDPFSSLSAPSPIEVTPEGIFNSPAQLLPPTSTLFEIVVNPEFPQESWPETLTAAGADQGHPEGIVPENVMLARTVFPGNVSLLIEETDAGIVIEVKSVYSNAWVPIVVSELGVLKTTSVKGTAFIEKALAPILITLAGISTLVSRDVLKALSAMVTNVSGKVTEVTSAP